MKLAALAEAMLWLPGFEPAGWTGAIAPPESLPVSVPSMDTVEEGRSGAFMRPVPAKPPKAVWPELSPALFTDIGGEVGKFNANMRAIEVLKALEAENRTPTPEERDALNRFTGWGGLPKVFMRYHHEPVWKERCDALRALLTTEEYEAAEASTPNAHFTSHEVIRAMWDAVERMGFKGGRVLEPAAGAGYFIGAMPKELAQASTVTAVELDAASAKIVDALYGEFGVKTLNQRFEKTRMPEGFYDLVISNVPFGNYPVNDAEGRWPKLSIHNYFIARALSLTRPGGLVACITSSYTMDSLDTSARDILAQMGHLVTAIRLPSGAFKAIANTEVMTDILIFQRRNEWDATDRDWCQSSVKVPEGMFDENGGYYDLKCNPYFIDNPSQVVGQFTKGKSAYSPVLGVAFSGDLAQALAERVAALPQGIVPPPARKKEVEVQPLNLMVASAEWVKPGAHVIASDNRLAVSVDGHTLEVIEDGITTAKARRLRAIIPVRDAARRVLAAQVTSDDDDLLERYRVGLLASYEAFVKAFGYISKPFNQSAYRTDPDFPLLLSLEHWDGEEQTATKADIFYRRTVGVRHKVERCETPQDALLVCLSERGQVVESRIAELLEMDANAAMETLLGMGLVFVDPETESYIEADAYLSGDVKTKLAMAEDAVGDYADNIEALKAVIPVDIPAHDLAAKLGASWIPADTFHAFTEHVLGVSNYAVTRNGESGSWRVKPGYGASVAATQTWGTCRVPFNRLMELAMNQQAPKVTDPDPNDPDGKRRVVNTVETVAAREKQEAIKDEFSRWVWACDERKAMLVKSYNDQFNRIVQRVYSGEHLTLPGFSNAYVLRTHQANAIWRCVASRDCTLLAHAVGAGKTLTMICAGMEMRRVGVASKPCYVVPNHMLEQFAAEFLRAYPAANVLIASKDDMAPASRKTLLARMATGDWDAVVLTHSSFEKVPVPETYTENVVAHMIAEAEQAYMDAKVDGDTRAVKELAKRKKVWQVRLEKRAEGKEKDDLLDFAEIGFDALFVDEAHLFKNLYRFTTMQMAGLPTNDSMRAFDMSIKVGFVQDNRGDGRGVVFATGTPVANSLAEVWVMQRYLQPRTLKAYGLENFDVWATNFGEPVTAMELSPDGSSYRVHTRFARFVNVPELLAIFRQVADIQTAEMMNLPVPHAIREIVTAEPSEAVRAYVAELVERAEAIRAGIDPRVDNMLKVTHDGKKAATDIRLCGFSEDDPGSKINLVVENVLEIWHSSASSRGAQLVFLDMGTPQAKGVWSLYEDIRIKLVAKGVPLDEVAFIHEHDSDKAKEKLFAAVRAGRVRVMVGSTSKMGMGTNVQERLVALHHVDGPWRPADVEQRDGRIVRQGNTNASVRIIRYVTAGTFDAYVWQTLETKARFIAQVMRGDSGLRNLEDAEMAALSYAEVKALASGNPMVIEKAGVDAEVMRLSMLKSSWQRQRDANVHLLATLPSMIRRDEGLLEDYLDDSAAADDLPDPLTLTFNGKVVAAGEDIGKRILGRALMAKPGVSQVVGMIGDFEVEVTGAKFALAEPEMALIRKRAHGLRGLNKTPRGVMAQIRALLQGMGDDVGYVRERIARNRAVLGDLRGVVEAPFEHAEALLKLLARQEEINALLCPSVGETTVDVDEGLAQAA